MPRALYSEGMADDLCAEIALGRSLREICENEPWAPALRTVMDWLLNDTGSFRAKYAHAREIQADLNADDIQYIADRPQIGVIETDKRMPDGTEFTEVKRADMIDHRRLRIDVRKWNAEKLRPKVYGARQMVEHSGEITVRDGNEDELIAEIIELVATGRLKLPGGVELEEAQDDEPGDDSDIA